MLTASRDITYVNIRLLVCYIILYALTIFVQTHLSVITKLTSIESVCAGNI